MPRVLLAAAVAALLAAAVVSDVTMSCKNGDLPDNEGQGFWPATFKLKTKGECEKKCLEDELCNAASWVGHTYNEFNCWLKTGFDLDRAVWCGAECGGKGLCTHKCAQVTEMMVTAPSATFAFCWKMENGAWDTH